MADEIDENIGADSDSLEKLLKSAYDSYQEDVAEANSLIKTYKDAMDSNPQLGIEMYGHFLAEAIKLKGSARERLLKIVNLLSNRVRAKEFMTKGQPDMFAFGSPEQMLAYIENMKLKKEEDKNSFDESSDGN